MRDHQIIIGLVGLPGAGKTSVADYLQKKGFIRITLSDLIKEEAQKKGIKEFSRETLQDLGNKMRRQYGSGVLAQRALKKVKTNGFSKVVIDGIRNIHEINFLKSQDHFVLVGLIAPSRLRYQRLVNAKGREWTGSYPQFRRQEEREERLGGETIGLRVTECLQQAIEKINNQDSLDHLYSVIDRLLRKYLQD